MDASKVAVAIAGGATVSPENLEDLLSDWLMIDTDEERAFKFYLPADSAFTTQVVTDTAQYLAGIDAGYWAVVGNLPRRGRSSPAIPIEQDAEDCITAVDGVIPTLIKWLLQTKENDSFEPYLMLAWGDDENGPDDETRELLSQALEAGIRVLDLTAGLDDLRYDEAPEDEAQAVPMVPVQLELPELEPAPEPMLRDEAQAGEDLAIAARATRAMIRDPRELGVADLPTTLAFVYQLLESMDRNEAARDMLPYMPGILTRSVKAHLADAVAVELADASREAEINAEPMSGPVEESPTKQRGKPRDTDSDVLTVFHDEAKQTIRLPVGRGRQKKGEEKFEMKRSEYEAIKAQYESN